MLAHSALVLAAMFTAIAAYISVVEQPARLGLDDTAALSEWRAAYRLAAPIQAGLALLSGACALAVFAHWGGYRWIGAAALILANWLFTWVGIRPINQTLFTDPVAEPKALIARWGGLHAVRTALGGAATLVMLVAILGLGD